MNERHGGGRRERVMRAGVRGPVRGHIRGPVRGGCLIAVLLGAVGGAQGLSAQPTPPTTPTTPATPTPLPTFARSIDLNTITGRDFNGLRVASTRQVGDVTIRAARAWSWGEGGGPGGVGEVGLDGLPIGTQRLFLQGDVVVDLGTYHFTAVRAVVWVQPLEPSTVNPADPDYRVRQVVVSFDRVADPGARAGFAQAADRLLVTGILDGTMALKCESVAPGRPDVGGGEPQGAFLRESEARLARYLKAMIDPSLPEAPIARPRVPKVGGRTPIVPGESRPFEPNAGFAQGGANLDQPEDLVAPPSVEPLFAKDGVVTFAVGTSLPTGATAPKLDEAAGDTETVRLVRGEGGEDNVVMLSGGVALQYSDLRKSRNLQITAERAVVFLEPGPLLQLAQFGADKIKGVYLEGDVVATDGQYTLRGPRVYYDLQNNKAVMVDAVFSTFDARLNMPIYVRAKSLKQEAANKFTGEGVRVSTSSFFSPVFSIGASQITIDQRKVAGDNGAGGGGGGGGGGATTERTFLDAKNLTLRLGGVPLFWVPGYKGEVDTLPLTDIRVENSSGSGGAIKTSWDAFGLLGLDRVPGLDVQLLIDGYFDRGVAGGVKSKWSTDEHKGQLFAYGLVNDDGRDVLSTGAKKEIDSDFRGLLLAEETWKLDENWTLQLELASQSDPTFVDAFFREIAQEGRELASSAYLKYQEGRQQLSLLVKGNLNNYVPNQYLLQSQGYVVEKAPEIAYTRFADDLAKGYAPGLLTWSHEYRISRMRFDFVEPLVKDYGFDTFPRSNAFAGLTPNQSLGDALRSAGLRETDVLRFDTRQEVVATFDVNPFKITPFVVGRFTGYDKTIGEFFANSPDAEDQQRIWYASGARMSTSFVRVDDSVESSLFDLHRVRHIIEPSVTAWTAASTTRQESLPTFDDDVEALNTGSTVRTGITQTWQTKRGGPGRWHNVDVFKLSTDLVFSTNDINERSPVGRFFEARPEYSALGNYFTADGIWQVSDSVALGSNVVYDFDLSQPARITAGGMIQHWPEFSTFAQVRFVNALDTTYVDFGASYKLTRRYDIIGSVTYDTDKGEVQSADATLRRRWPEATLGVKIGFDTIRDETSIGVVFEPAAVANRGGFERQDRLRDINR